MLCVARAGITVLVISVAVVRPAAVALLLLSGSCCACSAGYGRTAQLLSRVRAQALGCFRACFLNLRFRHLESRRSRGARRHSALRAAGCSYLYEVAAYVHRLSNDVFMGKVKGRRVLFFPSVIWVFRLLSM